MQGSDQVGHSNVGKVGTKWVTLMYATYDQMGHFNVGPPYNISSKNNISIQMHHFYLWPLSRYEH